MMIKQRLKSKLILKSTFLILMMLLLSSCKSDAPKLQSMEGRTQGSTYHIKYISDRNEDLKSDMDSIFEVIDLSMSTYRPESLISKINKGEDIKVDTHFIKVFSASQKIWKESNGLFDPTIKEVVDAWGFGKNKKHQSISEVRLDSLLNFVGFDKVKLTSDNHILKQKSEITFGFNAIAQGYTVDVIADFFKSKKIDNFLVEVGGEMFLSGENTIENKKWTVGIDDPLQASAERGLVAVLQFSNKGLATSGNYRKVWTDSITGEQYVHVINPKTGKAKQTDLLSVTVLADHTMMADAYATMFMVMGLEQSRAFLKQHNDLEVFFIYKNTENQVEEYATKGLKKLMIE